ncbi:MAG: cation-transporting P-type ATPase [Cyanobacteriota bacterium]|nr:cation-transporting P-type ATPase [Cyanobacteriota bacterium]
MPGLSQNEAALRLARYGPNRLPPAAPRGLLRHLSDQLLHAMALLLWVAGGLALLAGTPELALAIWAVVLVNGLFSFWQEHQAERTMAALLKALPQQVKVWRDGALQQLPADALVPGDCVELEAGDQVPADGRLIEAQELYLDLSALSGESLPVARHAATREHPHLAAGEQSNLVLAGTSVASGRGTALVYATGRETEFGHVAHLSAQTKRSPSTLEQQVAQIVRTITRIALGLGAVIFVLSRALAGMGTQESLIFAIGIIVANVPEGLLPTVTLSLAIAVRRMAQRQALVRRLSAVETLGSLSVICSDKTGTLTAGCMALEAVWLPPASTHTPQDLLRWACLCSNARLEHDATTHEPWRAAGDSTETALLNAAAAANLSPAELQRQHPRLHEVPFDSHRRRMSVVVRTAHGPLLLCKGAPAELLAVCGDAQTALQAQADHMASQGLRVLALAIRPLADDWSSLSSSDLEQQLRFVGLVGLLDPPRPEVPDAIAACQCAGIKVTMVTGDSGLTAAAIAHQIGLPDPVRVIEGHDLARLSPAQLRQLLKFERHLVFARATPEQKLQLVQAYRSLGEVVAVTGDGVNDAPALRAADVGIAMGRSGSDVAREAADIVLLDDNFATIVEAVRHGRGVVANIGRFLTYVIASNVAEMLPFVAMVSLQIPAALTVLQILAVDLGTDLLPALGLGAEPPEAGVMRHPPRQRGAALLDRAVLVRAYLVLGLAEALVAMAGYALVWRHHGVDLPGLQQLALPLLHHTAEPALLDAARQASTVTFVLIVAGQMGALVACRSSLAPFWSRLRVGNGLFWLGLLSEPAVASALVLIPAAAALFDLTALPRPWLGWLALAPAAVLAADTLHKGLQRLRLLQLRPARR